MSEGEVVMRAYWTRVTVGCGVLAALAYCLSYGVRARASAPAPAPFTLQTVIERYDLEGGSPARVESWTVATRTDGARVSREDSVGGRYKGVRIILEPVANRR